MNVFESCRSVNELLVSGLAQAARDELIQLLASIEEEGGTTYGSLVNRLVRDVGLYPYINVETAGWEERYVYEAFKADVGSAEPVTLHREQRRLLGALLDGSSIAVSAPTSFGKSFVIDAFIAIRRPSTVIILVPTIALADETRRRLQKKFGAYYKIITTTDQTLAANSILILPQERAIGYARELKQIDLLIVDEFYKASKSFDKERAPSLIRSIIKFGNIARQRYYLAPNIQELGQNVFTEGMEFLRLDFNTVFLKKTELYQDIGRNEVRKSEALLNILENNDGKTLIYAGTYSNITRVSNLLIDKLPDKKTEVLTHFQSWLAKHYEPNWYLTYLVRKGVGVHNGQLHRSLSQLQVKLFEDEDGLDQLISTSSIIEGVNTSAKNVVLWSNKNGIARLNDFTYKNIVGRGGRMFKHFIGNIFVLEEPPPEAPAELQLEFPDELLGVVDVAEFQKEYTRAQLAKIHEYEDSMRRLLGDGELAGLQASGALLNSDAELIRTIAHELRTNPSAWGGLRYLNSENPQMWERSLFALLKLQPAAWDTNWSRYVSFVKILAQNWSRTIPQLLDELSEHDIGIEQFFGLERSTTFRLASLLSDVQTIYNVIHRDNPIELSPAIARFSHAFLPKVVAQLEEYGLPRMLSKKISSSRIVDLETIGNIHEAISVFTSLGFDRVFRAVDDWDPFDEYILRYFFEGLGGSREHAQS